LQTHPTAYPQPSGTTYPQPHRSRHGNPSTGPTQLVHRDPQIIHNLVPKLCAALVTGMIYSKLAQQNASVWVLEHVAQGSCAVPS